MKQLEKIVERYNQHEPEWREEIETVKNLPEIKTPELRKILNEAVVVIRQMLKGN
ncbi:MAG: hypothetical protein K2P02_00795 [Lachnospiraceae bacterium]|jgi:hypothetical protein|nr:hypothetical protein [Lachnospiraceae bacterium]MDE6929283.1 hypothetical protein [Lachnospiraceae bacterium]